MLSLIDDIARLLAGVLANATGVPRNAAEQAAAAGVALIKATLENDTHEVHRAKRLLESIARDVANDARVTEALERFED